ncbi:MULTISPECIES: hypothetical protein [Thermomonospora]|uniref:Uncharacterized protein n=1 Tax=Thermomonospora cellulosilytica TaxID=1411118 RepID=A0A7W3R9L4_9ACTN|nr:MULTISPECIES: hypothetical protein [Thermomonospora]MBA9004891.1 hypothetical protein [Thermomonospora cellulosilytica]
MRVASGSAGPVRRAAADPLVPVLLLAMAAVALAARDSMVLGWAAVGALAGYSLSGSV